MPEITIPVIPCAFRNCCFNAALFVDAFVNKHNEVEIKINGSEGNPTALKLEDESDEMALEQLERRILGAIRAAARRLSPNVETD